jgi:DNA polymerase III delta prime subunit
MNFKGLWCEKYRPNSLDNIVLSEDTRKLLLHYKETRDIPHLLFVGNPGVGKTTTAKLIVNDLLKCDYLYINASDENGIDTIRHKIVGFAQTRSFDGGIKVVILDESDSLSGDGARALRNVMEEYSDTTRFILTANYKHKIIPAIQSRCQSIDFNHNLKQVAKHCIEILLKENIMINSEMIPKIQELIKVNFPDFRRILNDLQKYSISGTLIIRDSTIDNTFISNIVSKLKSDTILDVRNFIISNEMVFQTDYHNLLKVIFNYICDEIPDSLSKKESLCLIAHHMDRHSQVIDVEINCFACLVALSKLLHP